MFIWLILGCYGLALAILFVTMSLRLRDEANLMISRGLTQDMIDQFYRDMGRSSILALIQGTVILGTVMAVFACLVGWLATK